MATLASAGFIDRRHDLLLDRRPVITVADPMVRFHQLVIACRVHQASHEIDVLALARGARLRTPGTPIAFVGEAKHGDRRPGLAELRRLEHLRDLLTANGHDATGTTFGLFSASGFTDELMEYAGTSRGRLVLADLDTLYDQSSYSASVDAELP